MKQNGMQSSNLHRPIGDGNSNRTAAGATCMAALGVYEGWISHHSLRGHRRGRARTGDEVVDKKKDGEVRGVVVLLRLRFLSRRRRLLFLSDQAGESEAQQELETGTRFRVGEKGWAGW
jgi:hypothetical protein